MEDIIETEKVKNNTKVTIHRFLIANEGQCLKCTGKKNNVLPKLREDVIEIEKEKKYYKSYHLQIIDNDWQGFKLYRKNLKMLKKEEKYVR